MTSSPRKFIVYKSSAGSGKTFTLVREYLKIALQDPDAFRKVLAITFTNKAANEMKERVVRNLMSIADPEGYPDAVANRFLLPQLAEYLKLSEDQTRKKAAEVLKLILHHYAEFAVSTIDSFTYRVIRTFAHDLKIPLSFEVELDADSLLAQAVDLLISQVGSEEQLTRVLVDYVEKKANEELSWQIEKDLVKFGKNLMAEASIDAINEIRLIDPGLFVKVRHSLFLWKTRFENEIVAVASEAFRLIESENLPSDAFIRKEQGIYSYLKNLSNGRIDKIKPNSYVISALTTDQWIGPKVPVNQKAAFDNIAVRAYACGKKLAEMTDRDMPRYILCKLLLNNLFATSLLSQIEKMLDALCAENNKVLIGEFNRRISQVVREQPAPFIYERLGEKYHHYLIDEFQDTSVMQWHNLLPLIENSLSSNRMNLVVGDAKQAIYRWRSGDVEQFERLPNLIRSGADPLLDARENALIRHYQEETLDQNHRSSPVIVDFNNRLFSYFSTIMPEEYGKAFRQSVQKPAKSGKPGLVRIESISEGREAGHDYHELALARILSIINELKDDRFRWRDIAVLCRRNADAADIASFLIRHEVPVISSESLLLTQSGQVNFLISWIRHLNDPADSIPMVHILLYLSGNGLIENAGLEDFFRKYEQPSAGAFYEFLSGKFAFINFNRLIRLELISLVQYLTFNFDLVRQNDSYLQFFQDAVLQFVKTRKGGLADFLEWWEEKRTSLSVVIPEGIDAVRIMTIHKAKGLQFPVVIYPFADEKVKATRNNLWVKIDEDYAQPLQIACLPMQSVLAETQFKDLYTDEMNRSFIDLVNVLYVALTRPEKRLYVLLDKLPDKVDGTISVPKLFSRFLKDEGRWQQGAGFYEYGQKWEEEPDDREKPEKPPAEPLPGRPELKMLLRCHAPSAWDMDAPAKNREWGNLIHMALSLIREEDRADEVLDELVIKGQLSPSRRTELAELISGIFRDPVIGKFFMKEYEVRNEPEIMTREGNLYRPDRILTKNGRATVIDFKTGKQSPAHNDQIRNYARLMEEMKYQIEGAYLIYVSKQPEVVKVI